jgi:hypothetical protein
MMIDDYRNNEVRGKRSIEDKILYNERFQYTTWSEDNEYRELISNQFFIMIESGIFRY